MSRPMEFRDLPDFNRLRSQGVYLNSRAMLIRGNLLIPARAAFSPFTEALGVFTEVSQVSGSRTPLIGQVQHDLGMPHAYFVYLTPDSLISPETLSSFLETILQRLGEREAQSLTAEVDEGSRAYLTLRQMNFSVIARQNIWQLKHVQTASKASTEWKPITSYDEFKAIILYQQIVPALVQQVEYASGQDMRGWVVYRNGDLLGYADVVCGLRGTLLQPYFHPDVKDADDLLAGLLTRLKPTERKPVYVCLRSYNNHFTSLLGELGAEDPLVQAVLVRRLTVAVKKAELAAVPQLNGKRETSTPYTQSDRK